MRKAFELRLSTRSLARRVPRRSDLAGADSRESCACSSPADPLISESGGWRPDPLSHSTAT